MKTFILFDHDGVLVDTERWYYLANKRALAELGIELPLPAYLDLMADGVTVWTLARAAGVDEQHIHAGRARRDSFYRDSLEAEEIEIPGVVETLQTLSSCCRMAIITTAKRVDFELIHRHRKIRDYMEFVLTVEDYAHAKPHPEPYLSGLRRFQAPPAQTLVVEDSARGLKSAVAAGLDCVVVHNDFTASQDLSAAIRKIKDFRELPGLLETFAGDSGGSRD